MKKLLLYLLLFTSFGLHAQTNNYSLEFDGVDDHITVSSSPDYDNMDNFSIMFWAKVINGTSRQEFISKDVDPQPNGDWSCFIENGNLNFEIKHGNDPTINVSSSSALTNGVWHFIAISRDVSNGTINLYIDANLDGTVTGTTTTVSNTQDIRIGKHAVVNLNLTGFMDGVSIWNTVLTQQEIQQYMNCPPTGNEPGLVGYWNFEEGSGTTTVDQTTNSNDGNLNGGVSWSTDAPPYNCCTANPITTQPTDQTVNMGNDATFTFTDSLTAATYQWQLDAGTGYTNLSNAGQFSGTDTKTLTVSTVTMSNNNTNYRCLVTESSSCMDTTDVANLTVSSGNSINEYDNAAVKIYPNPTNGWVTLSLSNTTNGHVILTDVLGKEVLSKRFTSNEVQLNLKSLESKGTYFAKVLDSDGNVIAIKKLIYQ
jgi:hypothetical protein